MQRRCPYLEQIIRQKIGPLNRYKADCHVDRRTHLFTYVRRPSPPCLTNYEACPYYQRQRSSEDQSISRYTD